MRSLGKQLLPVVLICFVPLMGCGLAGQLAYWIKGNMVPARFDKMKEKKIAVVCVSPSNSGPGTEADRVARAVNKTLAMNLPEAQLIPHDKVSDWMDKNNWNQLDYTQVGKGVKADIVLGVELGKFSIYDGSTLLRGRANVGVKVFDMEKGGKLVYERPIREISYPTNGAQHITANEENFRTTFYFELAKKICRDFHPYDAIEDVAQDSAMMGN